MDSHEVRVQAGLGGRQPTSLDRTTRLGDRLTVGVVVGVVDELVLVRPDRELHETSGVPILVRSDRRRSVVGLDPLAAICSMGVSRPV